MKHTYIIQKLKEIKEKTNDSSIEEDLNGLIKYCEMMDGSIDELEKNTKTEVKQASGYYLINRYRGIS